MPEWQQSPPILALDPSGFYELCDATAAGVLLPVDARDNLNTCCKQSSNLLRISFSPVPSKSLSGNYGTETAQAVRPLAGSMG